MHLIDIYSVVQSVCVQHGWGGSSGMPSRFDFGKDACVVNPCIFCKLHQHSLVHAIRKHVLQI